jgi:hypothetical protein
MWFLGARLLRCEFKWGETDDMSNENNEITNLKLSEFVQTAYTTTSLSFSYLDNCKMINERFSNNNRKFYTNSRVSEKSVLTQFVCCVKY